MPEPVSDHAARNRWMLINIVRLAGVALVVIGLLINSGRIPAPQWTGYVVLAVGLIDVFFAPVFLARKWSSPKE